MSRYILLSLAASLAFGLPMAAQTNAPTNSTTGSTQTGPVVLPPADKAPVAPQNPQFQYSPSQQAPPVVGPSPGPAYQTPGPNPYANSAPAPNPVISPPLPPAAPLVVAPGAVAPPTTKIGKGEEIYDIRPPVFFLHGYLWLWPIIAGFILLSLIVLVWLWIDSRSVLNPVTAYDLALEKIEQAHPLMNADDPAPYAVAVSEAIRMYLSQRFRTPSDRRTTEEFLRQMDVDPGTPLAGHRDLLRDFLQSCDLLKFAQYHPHLEELEQVHQRAVTFVTATKPVVEKNARADASRKFIPQPA